jgi:hypothetical protein
MSDNEIIAILKVETALLKLEKATAEPELKQEAAMIREAFQRRRVASEQVHNLTQYNGDFGVGNE